MKIPRLKTIDRTERVVTNLLRTESLTLAPPSREPLAAHWKLPGYAPSPLVDLPALAAEYGFERFWLKDESHRLGLPAFKILGASWAVINAVLDRLGKPHADWSSINDLRELTAPIRPMRLACATDGNHGRAVARMARWLDFEATILVPRDMSQERVEAIRSEGADIEFVDGSYDDAVDASAGLAGERCLVISDTAWPGYESVPHWVIEGYSTILWEIDDQLSVQGEPGPDLVFVQIGVGALAAAVVRHYRRPDLDPQPVIVGVEPTRAACALASIEAGEIVQLPGPHDSIMSGLNCGVPSALAWPLISGGIDQFVAVDDDRVRQALRDLASAGIAAGECGAAGLAALSLLRERGALATGTTRALMLSTEGVTDHDAYARIVGATRA
jgi:diaminopropionate ammonia-lyase